MLSLTSRDGWAEPVTPRGKGVTGGILLGAELAILGEAIGGVERPWIYWAGAGAGAVVGGVGGHYLERKATPKLSLYSLMLGMALTLPATIAYLSATQARREAAPRDESRPNYDEEPPPLELPDAQNVPGAGGPPLDSLSGVGLSSLLWWDGDDLALGLPSVNLGVAVGRTPTFDDSVRGVEMNLLLVSGRF